MTCSGVKMTCIHEIVGPVKTEGHDYGEHVCALDDEICCEYWFGTPQPECKYYKEGIYSVSKSRLALLEYNRKKFIKAIEDIDKEILSLKEMDKEITTRKSYNLFDSPLYSYSDSQPIFEDHTQLVMQLKIPHDAIQGDKPICGPFVYSELLGEWCCGGRRKDCSWCNK
jgi:hypothetical protein